MSALADLSIVDAHTVTHVFKPLEMVNGLATFEDRSGGVQVGYPTLNLQVVRPSKNSQVTKVRVTLAVPKLETLASAASGFTPAPTVAYTTVAKLEVFLPIRGVLAERQDIRSLMYNALTNAVITAAIDTGEGVY